MDTLLDTIAGVAEIRPGLRVLKVALIAVIVLLIWRCRDTTRLEGTERSHRQALSRFDKVAEIRPGLRVLKGLSLAVKLFLAKVAEIRPGLRVLKVPQALY